MRQVRLDDDVVALVEAVNPAELSLSGRTNELLRELLTGRYDVGDTVGSEPARQVSVETVLPPGPRRVRARRTRGSGRPLSDQEARGLMRRLGQ